MSFSPIVTYESKSLVFTPAIHIADVLTHQSTVDRKSWLPEDNLFVIVDLTEARIILQLRLTALGRVRGLPNTIKHAILTPS